MKQTVYIKAESTDKVVDTFGLTKIGDKSFIHFISKHEGYFFTEKQLKQLLTDYTDKIIENVTLIHTDFDSKGKSTEEENIGKTYFSYEGYNEDKISVEVDKESITNQLEPFLKHLL